MLESLQAMVAGDLPGPPVAQLLGMRLVEVDEGRAVFELETDSRFWNPMGTVHGGILCDLADGALGVCWASTLGEGEIVGRIGPNGAGKTTAFNIITRLYKPNSGGVRYHGNDLLREPAHRVVRLGIARTFQNLQLCAHMSVLDNVLVGAHSHIG